MRRESCLRGLTLTALRDWTPRKLRRGSGTAARTPRGGDGGLERSEKHRRSAYGPGVDLASCTRVCCQGRADVPRAGRPGLPPPLTAGPSSAWVSRRARACAICRSHARIHGLSRFGGTPTPRFWVCSRGAPWGREDGLEPLSPEPAHTRSEQSGKDKRAGTGTPAALRPPGGGSQDVSQDVTVSPTFSPFCTSGRKPAEGTDDPVHARSRTPGGKGTAGPRRGARRPRPPQACGVGGPPGGALPTPSPTRI